MTSADAHKDRWLVRSVKNEIRGPFTAEELKDQLRAGLLVGADEVCAAGGYWFYLRESDEVVRAFGPEFPKLLFPPMEDTTETQLSRGKTRTGPLGASGAPDPMTDLARVLQGQPEVRGNVERASLLQALIWILVVSAGLIVGVVLKLLFATPA